MQTEIVNKYAHQETLFRMSEEVEELRNARFSEERLREEAHVDAIS